MKIGVVTATRAEYGLLKPLISKINDDKDCELVLIVTGTHLLKEYGYTIKYIEEDGFPIAEKVYLNIDTSSATGISKTMGRYFEAFSNLFQKFELDFLVVLGDRYELIPICYCAANAKIPIAHISGGEITEGAIDDTIRHCLTKLSFLHFPACDVYRNRIIQLGENPNRVFNFGDPGVENIRTTSLLSEKSIRNKIGIIKEVPYFVVIFHPVTLDEMLPEEQVKILLKAIDKFPSINFVILKSNADIGGQAINKILESYVYSHKNCSIVSSLRIEEYLSLQKYSLGLIGNSSSGIVETPCFGIPTINIGDRQKGRLFADSIIDCNISKYEIEEAIKLAISKEFREKAKKTINPYGSGNTSTEILSTIKNTIINGFNLKKKFYDLEVF
ncbi:UDP-N-acetylglucosamine 2-epimerase [Clostridium perfringens]|uniref:UDP-N-acetylglucosamine 2-epimerase n=1 Tax=Clostridium perfringens TaxID=1502 RepID=UPI00224522BE|nr:UDP-N-acetylglucosamine 2-epimerase [Clostridium perfringens]MCX0414572.1 UDP-N-acetylglucosamine 2-epimerase [Clostridium perfringens]